ncbi:hypothetical protein H2200_009628 [Cladophialophora chaetospira]|uniref:Piwi domain-containing protein n=1 Tax=Cladophialophora chaetospira TaxID=386627 RepID=A0AA39CF11_9EURO|nr:hypothetical protein H2200_009628 [Cladophialophora chaetospira]
MADRPNKKLDPTKSFTPSNASGSGQQPSQPSVPATTPIAWARGNSATQLFGSNVPARHPAPTNAPLGPAQTDLPIRSAPSNAPLGPAQPSTPSRSAPSSAPLGPAQPNTTTVRAAPANGPLGPARSNAARPDGSSHNTGGSQDGEVQPSGHGQSQQQSTHGQARGGTRTPFVPNNPNPIPASVTPLLMPASGRPQATGDSLVSTDDNQATPSTTKPTATTAAQGDVVTGSSSTTSIVPSRQQAVTSGKFLLANHFSITLGGYREVYSYPINIVLVPKAGKGKAENKTSSGASGSSATTSRPASVAKPKKKRLIQLLLNDIGPQLTSPVATDYQKELITPATLSDPIANAEYDFHYYDEYTTTSNQNSSKYRVTFGEPKLISLTDLFARFNQSNNTPQSEEATTDAINALNIIFSFLPYQFCFRTNPDTAPTMTTIKGQRFYGIPRLPAPRGKDTTWPTLTGAVMNRKDAELVTVPGFVRSVRPTFSGPGYVDLNIYTKTGSFWRHGTVQDLIDAWYRTHNHGTLDQLQEFLYSAPVRMIFPENNLDPFCGIRGLARTDAEPTAAVCTMLHPKRQCSGFVSQYYAHRGQFHRYIYVVKVGQKGNEGPLTIPASLLRVIPGKLKPGVIPQGGARLPESNYDLIVRSGRRTFISSIATAPGASAFGLTLSTNMATVPVTRLDRPSLTYRTRDDLKNKKLVEDDKLDEGQWGLKDVTFTTPAKRQKWTCIELLRHGSTSCTPQGIQDFAYHLEAEFKKYGMTGFEWWQIDEHDDGSQQWQDDNFLPRSKTVASLKKQEEAVKDMLRLLTDNGVTLVVLLLPSQDQDLYSAIKRAGEQIYGIATVCHVLKLTKKEGKELMWPKTPRSPYFPARGWKNTNFDFLGNLCMKINLKVENTAVNQALDENPDLLSPETMIIGIDVAHAGGPRRGCPSIAAVVGSVNPEFSQYPASIGINACIPDENGQPQANEEVMDLDDLVLDRLREYYRRNHDEAAANKPHNGIPSKLIVYRDGVSESQFEMCKGREYGRIKEAVTRFLLEKGRDTDQALPVTLICAIKRHHTRVFRDMNTKPDPSLVLHKPIPNDPDNMNNNPLPGTLIEERITYGEGNDFFLIGHKAIQGTAIPVHYNVLQNPCNYLLRDIAEMTYDLCFLFGRSRTSVGLCTPVYYADLVTARARCYVRERWYSPPKDPDHKIKPFDSQTETADFEDALRIHPNMAEKMFYI